MVAQEARRVAMEAEARKKELEELEARSREIEQMQAGAEQEEKRFLEETASRVDGICNDAGLFCGVVLSFGDVVSILELMIQTRENVRIPFKLYFNE